MAEYAAPDLLASTDWLANHLNDSNIRIVEVGEDPKPFLDGHIPGAVHTTDWHIKSSKNARLVAPPDEAKSFFESLGVGDDTLVVAYDRMRNRDASRVWWVLTYYGHTNVKVLNGGWKKWSAEGRSAEQGAASSDVADATFTPKSARHEMESTVDKLKAAIGQSDALIWDTRSADEYTGKNDRGNKRKGHVPGAVHLEWVNLVNEADHTFKSADELKALLDPLGITPEKTVHTY